MESLSPEIELYYGERISNSDGTDFFSVVKM